MWYFEITITEKDVALVMFCHCTACHALRMSSDHYHLTLQHTMSFSWVVGNRHPMPDVQNLVLVGGGVGVTPLMSLMQGIHDGTQLVSPNTSNIEMIWIVRNPQCFEWFDELLAEISLRPVVMHGSCNITLSVHLFYTGEFDIKPIVPVRRGSWADYDLFKANGKPITFRPSRKGRNQRSQTLETKNPAWSNMLESKYVTEHVGRARREKTS